VVGGGIAGFAAAWALRDRDVVLLEESDRVGGRIFAQIRDPYWLNFGAHLLRVLDTPLGRLAEEVGSETLPVTGELEAWMNGRLVRGGSVERFPVRLAMPLAARLSLICTGLRLRRANDRALRGVGDPVHGDNNYDADVVEVVGDAALDA
jgi:oxygen-dependent protoporphyrinogen oxidase